MPTSSGRPIFEDRVVSTAAVAASLGVSVSTIKRWIDQGVLPAQRTAGGHRRLWASDVVRAVQSRALPQRDLSLLGWDASRTPSVATLCAELHDSLTRGDTSDVRRVIQVAYGSGLGAARLADEIVGPAMTALGHDWETERIDVFQEHRGTQSCAAALYELKIALAERRTARSGVAIGGGIEGDPYLLANLLAELVLLEGGWEVVNIGPNTPVASFSHAIGHFRPRLMWLSISYVVDADALVEGYAALHRDATRRGTAVAIGGRALMADLRAQLPYTMFGDGLRQFAAFAASLAR